MADMKMKAIGLTLAFCFLAGTTCFAADSQMGTWMLNEAKSKMCTRNVEIHHRDLQKHVRASESDGGRRRRER